MPRAWPHDARQVDTQSARKELVLSERQARAAEALARLSEGAVLRGEVSRVEDYGAIVALLGPDGAPMGVQGLVHKKELSYDVVMAVEDLVKLGAGGNTRGHGKAQMRRGREAAAVGPRPVR